MASNQRFLLPQIHTVYINAAHSYYQQEPLGLKLKSHSFWLFSLSMKLAQHQFLFFDNLHHLISDQGSVFTSAAFRELLDSNRVKIRYGAIGEHGSISVTERVIETLKYEWLKKVAIIQGFQHLTNLCNSFTEWYNNWRPHEYLGSTTPDFAYRNKAVPFVAKTAKDVPIDLETKRFRETKVTGYRIKKVA